VGYFIKEISEIKVPRETNLVIDALQAAVWWKFMQNVIYMVQFPLQRILIITICNLSRYGDVFCQNMSEC
jgi:hypothetical protein